MAGPISGIGQQQIPAANTFQPGGNANTGASGQSARDAEQTSERANTILPEGSEVNQTQASETQNTDVAAQQQDELEAAEASSQLSTIQSDAPPQRGSVVDIVT